jgi:hypothetical protein
VHLELGHPGAPSALDLLVDFMQHRAAMGPSRRGSATDGARAHAHALPTLLTAVFRFVVGLLAQFASAHYRPAT